MERTHGKIDVVALEARLEASHLTSLPMHQHQLWGPQGADEGAVLLEIDVGGERDAVHRRPPRDRSAVSCCFF